MLQVCVGVPVGEGEQEEGGCAGYGGTLNEGGVEGRNESLRGHGRTLSANTYQQHDKITCATVQLETYLALIDVIFDDTSEHHSSALVDVAGYSLSPVDR